MTLEGFLKHFKDKYNLELSMVSCGVSIVYSMFSSRAKERMQVQHLPPAASTHFLLLSKSPPFPSRLPDIPLLF